MIKKIKNNLIEKENHEIIKNRFMIELKKYHPEKFLAISDFKFSPTELAYYLERTKNSNISDFNYYEFKSFTITWRPSDGQSFYDTEESNTYWFDNQTLSWYITSGIFV